MYPNLWKSLQQQAVYYNNKPFATFGNRALAFDTLMAQVKSLSGFLKTATDRPVVGINLTDPLQNITSIFASLVAGKAFWVTSEQIVEKTESGVLEDVFIIKEALYSQGLSFPADTFEFEEELVDETPFCWATSSGSLATPKITEHSYYSLMEDTFRQVHAHNIAPNDRIDIIASMSFSASLSSIFPALFAGASLHLYDNKSLAITGIYEFWRSERITMTTIIPTVFRSLMRYDYDFKGLDIRFICIGGEPVYSDDITLFQLKFPKQSKLQIAIASSEARSIGDYITDTETPVPNGQIPYSAVSKKHISIVDDSGLPLASYETGRIAITSKVIGTRYVQGPDSFSKSNTGGRLFISDDLGSINLEGKLIIDGTAKRRLKLKGEFIDLNQLEHHILSEEGVQDCLLHLSRKGTVLSVFIQSPLKKPQVRKLLATILKSSAFQLYLFDHGLPKTHSGKLDIPLILSLVRSDRNIEYSNKDLIYYDQWQHIFPSESDFEGKHFFKDLGGDSISAVELTTRLCKAFELEIEPNAVYIHPYYEELFNYIKTARPYQLKNIGDFDQEKPNILFFPSLNGVYENYLPIIDLLRKNYNTFLIQHPPGSGKSYESPDTMAKKCANLLAESPYTFSCFVGYSFSGYQAYCTAHYTPTVGLVMLDTHTYKPYGKGRKKVANMLRGTQALYQHATDPKRLKFLIKRRLLMTNKKRSSKIMSTNSGEESHMLARYNDFFRAFERAQEKIPQTNFPLGIFKASNSSNVRYLLEYDFNWKRYNNNIKFSKTLPGKHSDFFLKKENIEVIAQQLDDFIKSHCAMHSTQAF